MKAYMCDSCKKEPAAYRVRIRFSPYFEKDKAVAVKLGDICKLCVTKKHPEFKAGEREAKES